MRLQERIEALTWLGRQLLEKDDYFDAIKNRSFHTNNWLTVENINLALENIQQQFLQKEKLEQWAKAYDLPDVPANQADHNSLKRIAIIMIGNSPLANFHDLISVFVSGHHALIRLSEDDKFILPFLIEKMTTEFPAAKAYFSFVERMENFKGVIANGNKTSKRYLKTYFGKYPNIIRENKVGIAVLDGTETSEDLTELGKDFFSFFGLARRSISKIYVPKDYDFVPLLEAFHEYKEIVMHNKYKNNFDYNYTLHLLNNVEYKANGCVMLLEDEALRSRISNLHYEYYSAESLRGQLEKDKEEIECIVSKMSFEDFNTIPFGRTAFPFLTDYAGGNDVMQFLKKIEG